MPDTSLAPSWLSLLRNPAVTVPIAAAVGGLLVAVVIEGPKLIGTAVFGFQERGAEVKQKQADADQAQAKANAANLPASNALGGASEGMPVGANKSATGLPPLVERPTRHNP